MGKTYKDRASKDIDFENEAKLDKKPREKRKGRKKNNLRQEIHEQMIDEGLFGI